MKAKLVRDLFERYFDNKIPMENSIQKYLKPGNAEKLKSPFGYYDMSNALEMSETVIPELRGIGIRFQYQGYSNFLVVFVRNEKEAYMVKDIIENIGEGERMGDDEILYHLANEDSEVSDAAYIALI
jgi:hypothetical protein